MSPSPVSTFFFFFFFWTIKENCSSPPRVNLSTVHRQPLYQPKDPPVSVPTVWDCSSAELAQMETVTDGLHRWHWRTRSREKVAAKPVAHIQQKTTGPVVLYLAKWWTLFTSRGLYALSTDHSLCSVFSFYFISFFLPPLFLFSVPQGYSLGFNSCSLVQQRYGVLLSLVWW